MRTGSFHRVRQTGDSFSNSERSLRLSSPYFKIFSGQNKPGNKHVITIRHTVDFVSAVTKFHKRFLGYYWNSQLRKSFNALKLRIKTKNRNRKPTKFKYQGRKFMHIQIKRSNYKCQKSGKMTRTLGWPNPFAKFVPRLSHFSASLFPLIYSPSLRYDSTGWVSDSPSLATGGTNHAGGYQQRKIQFDQTAKTYHSRNGFLRVKRLGLLNFLLHFSDFLGDLNK